MGIADLTLIDFDVLKPHNLDRSLHATAEDVRKRRRKVDVLAERLKHSATARRFTVEGCALSIVEESGFRRALDCDVLFSCVDRPWPRFVLNFIAYAHLIPVIDGGISLQSLSNNGGLKRGTWKAHVVAPEHRCLECLGQYQPSDVSLERSGLLDDPRYIDGLDSGHHLRRNENVFTFSTSVASREVLHFLRMTVPHPGFGYIGGQTEHFVSGLVDTDVCDCEANCPFPAMVAKGDYSGFSDVTGTDTFAAQQALEETQQHAQCAPWIHRAINYFRSARTK
jgi:hypothetical protein